MNEALRGSRIYIESDVNMGVPGSLDKLKDKEKVSVLEQRIQFQSETIDNQKKQVAEYKEEIDGLNQNLEKLSSSIQSQTGIIAEQQRTLKDQESTILEQQMSISGLQKQVVDLQTTLDDTKSQLGAMEGKTRGKSDEQKAEVIELKRTLEAKQIEFNDIIANREESIKDLGLQIAELERKARSAEELEAKSMSSEDSASESRITDLEKALSDAGTTIQTLEKQLQENNARMETEIQVRDVKVEEYERMLKSKSKPEVAIRDFVENTEDASKALIDIFSRTKSNVMVITPDATILDNLDFDNLRPAVRILLAIPVKQNLNKVNQLKRKSSFEIRDYSDITGNAFWGIIRDNEELLLAPIGDSGEPSGLIVRSGYQIETFGNIIRSTWTRLKRVL